jgi:aminocarboxymuconate-semialdehyde decarboxylase
MDQHGIDISFVRYCSICYHHRRSWLTELRSSANPWLDFLPFSEAQTLAQQLNADLESYCATGPALASDAALKRLYGFGLLPLVPGAPTESLPEAVSQLATQYPHIRGVILGTRGAGLGLDDPALEPLWAALAETGLVVFLHPQYGIGTEAWGSRDNGHVLPLALGFPLETTIVRLFLLLPLRRSTS